MLFFCTIFHICVHQTQLVSSHRLFLPHSKSSIIIAADESTISWGPSPTFGELVRPLTFDLWPVGSEAGPHCVSSVLQGYGDNKPKSSTTAQEVKTLDGVYIEQVNGSNQRFWSGSECGKPLTLLLHYSLITRTPELFKISRKFKYHNLLCMQCVLCILV